MLTEKQKEFYNLIYESFLELKVLPSIGYLKRKSTYKSYNTIHKYLSILKRKGYIDFDKSKKQITYLRKSIVKESIILIPFVDNTTFLTLPKVNFEEDDYIAYKIHNNRLIDYQILNKDILIFSTNKTKLNNKIVLVFINNEYKVLKYKKEDGYIHLLNNKENYFLLNNQNILGKLVTLIRNTMD